MKCRNCDQTIEKWQVSPAFLWVHVSHGFALCYPASSASTAKAEPKEADA